MKILWITHSPFPIVSNQLQLKNEASGWVLSSANALIDRYSEINLAVASFYNGHKLNEIKIGRITHFLVPEKPGTNRGDDKNDYLWRQIKNQFNPELIHIHGTERPHCYSYIRACGSENVVVSIQGIISIIEKYYYGGISKIELLKSITFRDIVKFDTVFSQRCILRKQGIYEKLIIQKVNHVIGRTSWDRAHVWSINPIAKYHFCNETLRPLFYRNHWSIEHCEKFSIFVSQAYYPIKGFHQLLKALPIVQKHFPNVKVYVAGNNFCTSRGIKINGFGRFIKSLINKYKLANLIVFTGTLSEEAMCKRFINSHLFINPSAIENSSNSIGEAQILGVPCIASYVGGTPDMIEQGETGLLYRFEEVEMLAANICRIFSDNKLALNISEKSRIMAEKRHDNNRNATNLYNIYSKIIAKSFD
jgi:glycosyltransferase involved in cell wall biosynthesis